MVNSFEQQFLTTFSVEVTPKQVQKLGSLKSLLPSGTRVFIAHIDGTPIADMVSCAKQLHEEGFSPVPHFPARIIPSEKALGDWIELYSRDAGVQEALVIAGGINGSNGPFTDSMQLLETGLFEKGGMQRLVVAGHPEGNKDIGERGVREALDWKNDYAVRTGTQLSIATQFAFEAQPVIDWANRIAAEGNRLPVHIGVAGPAKLSTLVKYAAMCGVGASMRILTKQARNVTKLMSVRGPDDFVSDLARHKADVSNSPIAGMHFFPLGGLAQTADWIASHRGGMFPQPGLGVESLQHIA